MTKSTFYHDGYRDRVMNKPMSKPDANVYANEYINGYRDACSDIGFTDVSSISEYGLTQKLNNSIRVF